MKANELRIGSIFCPIDRSGEVHLPITSVAYKVFSIDTFKVTGCFVNKKFASIKKITEFNIRDIDGIPLTEEILLKSGFKKCSDCGELKGNDCFYTHPKFKGCLSLPNFTHDLTGITFKYVHTLQNYFALTGHELEINL